MNGSTDTVSIAAHDPRTFGWMRNGEYEDQMNTQNGNRGFEVWEQPDGKLHLHDPKHGKLWLYRNPRLDLRND